MAEAEEEHQANREGCFIIEVKHPKTGALLCIDDTSKLPLISLPYAQQSLRVEKNTSL